MDGGIDGDSEFGRLWCRRGFGRALPSFEEICAVASVMRAASGCVVLPLASATLGTRSVCRVLLVFQILLVCVNCCPTSIEADMGLIETVRVHAGTSDGQCDNSQSDLTN